jgi:hypothetical protein
MAEQAAYLCGLSLFAVGHIFGTGGFSLGLFLVRLENIVGQVKTGEFVNILLNVLAWA